MRQSWTPLRTRPLRRQLLSGRRLLLALLVPAPLLLAACGTTTGTTGTTAGSTSGNVLRDAYAATLRAGTAEVSVTTQQQSGRSTTTAGVLDLRSGDRDLTTDRLEGGRRQVRVVAGHVYQRELVEDAVPLWSDAPAATHVSGVIEDGQDVLALLRLSSAPVETVGTEQVRGGAATHYRTQLDLVAPGGSAGLLRAVLQRDTLPADVWVDSRRRIVRLRTTALPALPTPTGGAGTTAFFVDDAHPSRTA